MLHSQNARKSLTLALEEVPPSSRAKSQEPRAKSQEPRAKSQEPRAKSQEPRAKSQEPRAKSQEPRAKSHGAAMSAPRASRGDASSQSDSQPSAAPAGARLSDTPQPHGLSRSTARRFAACLWCGRTLLGLLAVLSAVLLAAGNARAQGTVATDRAALVALYNATGGANWTDNTNWTSNEALSEWHGVTTDANGRVTDLYLTQNGLSGEIPAELGDLTSLLNLYLWQNNLSGEIPAELGGLTSLLILYLGDNNLSGEIPAELGGLTSLQNLYLAQNGLSGEIPAELGDLTSLLTLDLQNNNLSGEIPAELGGLTSLQNLFLRDNNLSGEIPAELGGLTSLLNLYLRNNNLSGEIPAELGDLSSLLVLDLQNNNLSGEIPAELGGLTNLQNLYLAQNGLSGEIPAELGDLSSLQYLYLWGTELSGEIPAELGGLSSLLVLDLARNNLSGEIPAELGDLTSLWSLFLWGNYLSGEIPAELGDLTSLFDLDLAQNNLSGPIPAELGNLANLEFLYLNQNELSGEIPAELGDLAYLLRLDLAQNNLSGAIPAELEDLANLQRLYLHSNELTGPIPSWLVNLTGLLELSLWSNQLTGTIPPEVAPAQDRAAARVFYNSTGGANWTDNTNWRSNEPLSEWHGVSTDAQGRVDELRLSANGLTGTIGAELGVLTHLTGLYLNDNELTGSIPPELENLAQLQVFDVRNTGLSCVMAGSELHTWLTTINFRGGAVCVPLPEGDLGATSVFAKRYRAGNVKITWNDITIDGTPLPPGQPDYAVTVSGGRRNTTWGLSHLETVFGDPLGRGNRYTVEHPTSTSDNNNQSDHDVAFTYTLKVIGDGWLASGKTFLRIDCPAVGSANAVNCGLSTAPSALRLFNASAYESYGPMQFRVEVDPPSSGTVTVDYATANRTSGSRRALAGQDYYATSGTLTFAPGETAKFVVVGIIDDAVRDGGETFYLNFSNATGATLSDGQATGTINNTEPLTASFEGVPEAHDGQSAFSFRVAFSEEIGISYQTLRDESFTTTGGAVTGARRVDGRNDLWEITVEPSGAENVTITLPRGRDCGTTGAVCTREDEDTPRALTNSPSATVKGPSASGGGPPSDPLTASFSGVPDKHTGESFTFGLTFSEDVAGLSYKTLRDSAFSVRNGQITRARRKQKGSNQGWTITVKPDSSAAVTIRLPATTDCEADDAICTSDDRPLSNSPSATVNGPGGTLSFAHFANGDGVTSEVVIVNMAPQPIRPRLSFYDPEGNLMDPQSLLDMLGDLEITEDGAVRVRTEIEPLGELAIATHGRGPLRSGSVKVGSGGSVGGMLRFDLPGIGKTVVGPGQPTSDAIFGVRRREGGINTWAAIHNLESSPGLVRCELLRQGVLLDAVVLPLAANGQTSWTIDEAFQAADTSDLVGSVRCTALGEGQFTAMAVELDAGNGIFTTLPLVPVSPGGETTLEFAHLPNGDGLTSEVVLVNVASHAIRPTLYFFDPQGEPIAAESLLEVGGDLAIQADGGLTVWREMEPLGELAISTHGRGPLRSGSVKVMSDGPIGGFLRFHLPGVGVAGVGASQPMRDAIFPVRRREGGTHTGVVLRNLSETELALTGRLMKKGAVLEEVEILLEGGQEAWHIEEGFTGTDMSDFEGSVRFTAVGEGQFTGMAVELDAGNRIFTTLPVMPVTERMSQE